MRSLVRPDCSQMARPCASLPAARFVGLVLLCILPATLASAQSNIVTYHYDVSRSGLNSSETILTPSNVNASEFGKLFSYSVDASIYAEPLYVQHVAIPGAGTHNVVFVATQNDSVYAFDADSNAGANSKPLWHVSMLDAAHGAAPGATPSSTSDVNCKDITPIYGITGTPTIDPAAGIMYLVAASTENGSVVLRLHSLDITTGAEVSPGPVVISAAVPGTGDGSDGTQVAFDPATQMNRAGLLLLNNTLYVAFGSHCDNPPYHGWLLAYDASSFSLTAAFNSSPNDGQGGIWMGGGAPAVDSNSDLYFATGNGFYDGGTAFGDTILKVGQPSNGSLPVLDRFTPSDQSTLSSGDLDQGSGGVLLLPDQPAGSPRRHLLVTGGKDGTIYLLDRDHMGHFHSSGNQVWQSLPNAIPGLWSTPAWWNNNVFLAGSGDIGQGSDHLRAFAFDPATDKLSSSSTSHSSTIFSFPAPTPVVTANGTNNAIVWVLQTDQFASSGPAVLHAYDATDLSKELYNSSQNLSRDNPGPAVKFTVPTAINGKIYVGTKTQLAVFGSISLLSAVSVNPTVVLGGGSSTGTISLLSPAPAGGIVVSLSSSNPASASVPTSVSISGGATSGTFSVSTSAVTTSTAVTISASIGPSLQTATLTVVPALASLSLSPTTVQGGNSSTGTITLAAAAPAGGISVSLSSSNVAATVPGSVPIPGGATTATFTVSTSVVPTTTSSLISASYSGATQSATLTVNAAARFTGVSFVRAAGNSGESTKYTIGISPASGDFVALFVWQVEGATTPTVTDNVGNSYVQDCDFTYDQGSGPRRLTVYHLPSAPIGITGIRVTPNRPSRAIAAEYTGMPAGGGTLDVCGAVNNQNTTTSWSSSATATAANDIVFGLTDTGQAQHAQFTANGAWTGRFEQGDSVDEDDSFVEDQLNAAPGAYTAKGTSSAAVKESSVVVAFKLGTVPTITSASSATFLEGAPGSFTIVATGSPKPTFTETGSLPSGLTLDLSAGVLSGTPAEGTAGNYSIAIIAQNGIQPNATQNFTLTVADDPVITSANGTTFTVGTAGSFTVTATGFPAPTFSESGALPAGLTLAPATGVLSGTPATGTGGTYTITITAQNGVSPNATQGFTLTVSEPPMITSANSATFAVGTAASFTITATGTPPPTFSETGALPAGVTFSSSTGMLSGTPATGTAGTYSVSITAQNGSSPNATQNFTLTVNQAPAITSASSTTFTVGTAGTFTVAGSGFPAPTFSESGALPAGVTWAPATGVLSGTPASGTGGTYAVTFTAQNGVAPNATQTFTLTVNQAPAITSSNSATFIVGTAGAFGVTATGTPAPTFSETGPLPAGLTLNSTTGALSGTPATGTAGSYSITITAQNAVAPNASQNFVLTVNQAPAIGSAASTTFVVGSVGTFTVTGSGFPAPTFSESGTLPSGVTLAGATGVLSGTPAAGTGGTYAITITAQNGVAPSAAQTFTLTVDQPPAITSAVGATFVVGSAGAFTVAGSGFPAPTFSESGMLPSGVSLAPTGTLSGTPAAGSGGIYAINITAQNGISPSATQSFTLTVSQPPAITSPNSAAFTVGAAGAFVLTATGTPAPTFSETGALPPGLTLNSATGVLSGTPASGAAGSYSITITAQNGVAPNASQNFVLAVGQAPAITSSNGTTFSVGTAGSFTVAATGFPAPTVTEAGALPSGVSFNPSTNALSGTPAPGMGGVYPITFTAHNGVGPDVTQNFTLTVRTQPAFIRAAGNTGAWATYTVSLSPAAGDFVAVFVWQEEGAGTPKVTDNLGTTYTKDCNFTYDLGSGLRRLTVYHLLAANAGITGVSILPDTPSRTIVAEYAGITSTATLDVCGAVNTQVGTVNSWSSTTTSTTASDIVFGLTDTGTNGNAGYAATGAWHSRLEQQDTENFDDSFMEDQVNVASGSYTAAGTTSSAVREASVVVGFKVQ
jgi:hypothetical protein